MKEKQLRFLEIAQSSHPRRPIHYIGIKTRALDAIEQLIRQVVPDGSVVCDLFAGSGVVSARLSNHFTVVASDIQEYSRVLTSAQLNPPRALDRSAIGTVLAEVWGRVDDLRTPAMERALRFEQKAIADAVEESPDLLASIIDLGSLQSHNAFPNGQMEPLEILRAAFHDRTSTPIVKLYGGVYFSFLQALELDAIIHTIRELPDSLQDAVAAAMLSTASELVSTVGNQFAQPIKTRTKSGSLKLALLTKAARLRTRSALPVFESWMERYAALPPSSRRHTVTRQDYRDRLATLPTEVAVIYADPPYTRDHYSRFYHVLETLARMDQPRLSMVGANGSRAPSRVGYRDDRHQSPFSIPSQVTGAFTALFAEARRLNAPIVLSYSPSNEGTVARPRPRLMTIEDIVNIGQGMGFDVEVSSAGRFAHSKFNAMDRNSSLSHDAEVLILAMPSTQ